MIKMNDKMWVHQNKEPADSGGVQIDAEGMSPQKRVPLRQESPMDRSGSDRVVGL